VLAVPTEAPTPDVPRAFLWIFPPVYFLHLLDERFFGIGTAAWATRHMGIYLTNDAWLIINVVWFALLSVITWLVARGTLPNWVVVVLATHIAIHSLTRIWGSIVFPGWSPGVLTGVVVGLPWAAAMFYWARRTCSRRQLALGVIGGVLSLQPLWDFLMLPVLSPRPPAV
jgi:hypothetical protein